MNRLAWNQVRDHKGNLALSFTFLFHNFTCFLENRSGELLGEALKKQKLEEKLKMEQESKFPAEDKMYMYLLSQKYVSI